MSRVEEIYNSVMDIGVDATAIKLGKNGTPLNRETVRRYVRTYKNIEPQPQINKSKNKLLEQISKLYSEAELKQLIEPAPKPSKANRITLEGEVVRIGIISDTHIGSKYFDESWFDYAIDEFHNNEVDMILHAGDVTEGISNRAGHVYECSHFGYKAQLDYALELFQTTHIPIKAISGNHDNWFVKSSGAFIVQDIADRLEHFEYLGHNDADLYVNDVHIKLWHGEDGASLTHSLRPQKVVDSLYNDEKPDIIIMGHTHKAIWYFDRNVQVISAGALSRQTGFMRGKRIMAHTGFYIIEMVINDGEIKRFTPSFYPFYK